MFQGWLHILFFWLAVLPVLAQAPVRHWELPQGDVYLHEDFSRDGPDLNFERVTSPDEANHIASIIGQDSSGFVWLASRYEYILRYDGQRFERFDTPRPMGNTKHFIDAFTNSIWLATFNGLCCFDMANGTCLLYANETSPKDSLFERVFYDQERQVLLCTGSTGCFEFSLSEQRFTRQLKATLRNADTKAIVQKNASLFVADIKPDNDGSYWLASVVNGASELVHYQPDTGEGWIFPRQVVPATGIADNNRTGSTCYSLYIEPGGRLIWVAGAAGLKSFDKQARRWRQFLVNKPEHDYAANLVYDVLPWGERHLALTSHNGLHLFDKYKGQFFNYQFFSRTLGSHWSHIVHQPLLDRDNNLWVLAGISGFFRLDPRKQLFNTVQQLPDHFSPHQIYIDTLAGVTWLLGIHYEDTGIKGIRLDEGSGRITPMRLPFCQAGFLPEPKFNRAWVSAQKYGCAGVNGGIWFFDLSTGKTFQPHLPVSGCPSGVNSDSLGECRLSMAPNGDIWIGSLRYGLLHCKAGSGLIKRIYPKQAEDSLAVAQVFAGSNGLVWFVPAGGRVAHCLKLDDNTLRSFSFPDSVERGWSTANNNMVETADGQIWTSIGQQLYRLEQHKDTCFTIVPDIFPSANYLSTDEEGNLWCNTRYGLATYNCRRQRWKVMHVDDGLPESPGDEPVTNCYNDRMFITGAAWFHPSGLRFNEAPASPVFTGLRVNEKTWAGGRFLNQTRSVELLPGENSLTIEFAATNFTDNRSNTFACRLSRVNDDWVQIGSRQSVSFTNLQPGRYLFELKAANRDGFWSDKIAPLNIYITPYFYQTGWFKWLSAILLLALTGMLYQNRIKAIRREALLRQKDAEMKQKEAEFKQQLSELEMAALRSQMNPHFIFNVLNSIHFFLASNNAEIASDYLMKFSRLVRLVLDNGSQRSVTLHKDLTALQLYLEMEVLRFGGKLQYFINMDPAIDQKYLRLPPMLIQPYVENAIWHGLMQKKGGGSVTINFRQMTEQLLQVEVIDNGIGRVAAMALKSKSAITRKSYGMDLTARRLALLDNPENPSVFINVEDLLNENGEVAGTKVVLRIPV